MQVENSFPTSGLWQIRSLHWKDENIEKRKERTYWTWIWFTVTEECVFDDLIDHRSRQARSSRKRLYVDATSTFVCDAIASAWMFLSTNCCQHPCRGTRLLLLVEETLVIKKYIYEFNTLPKWGYGERNCERGGSWKPKIQSNVANFWSNFCAIFSKIP